MTRDNKGRVIKEEVADARAEAVCYRSKLLNKYFDTYEELVEAEEAYRKAEEEKQAAIQAKKAEAGKVQEAFVALNAAKKDYNKVVLEARQTYSDTVKAARSVYDETVADEETKLAEAEEAYDAALVEFQKAHPEGYHMTLRDGDNVMTISRSGNNFQKDFEKAFSWTDTLMEMLRKM